MRRDVKTEKEKSLRKLYKEYVEEYNWTKRRDAGTYVEVDPYQRGWVRYFDLRDDIKNRDDARVIRQCLDLINNDVICDREDFTRWNYKKKIYEPISQPLGRISEKKYEELDNRLRKHFYKVEVHERWMTHSYFAYEFINKYYFVFVIEPNIITHHWLPDPAFETRRAELQNKLYRDNLWPKITHIMGGSYNHKDWRLSPYMKNKRGDVFSEDDYDSQNDSLEEAI